MLKTGAMPYDYFLFDLGHVLVQLRTFGFLQRFKPEWDQQQIEYWWSNLSCIHLFETGRIDEQAFLQMAVQETAFAGTINEFRDLFASWVLGVYPGAEALINDLKTRVRIGVLSNTNALHINILRGQTTLLDAFHDRFLSYEMGWLKPDKRVYTYVLEQIKIPAARVVFFDDNEENIEAAAAIGLQSIWVSGFNDLTQKIDRFTSGNVSIKKAEV